MSVCQWQGAPAQGNEQLKTVDSVPGNRDGERDGYFEMSGSFLFGMIQSLLPFPWQEFDRFFGLSWEQKQHACNDTKQYTNDQRYGDEAYVKNW
ncbi:hypothetical protein DPQ33_09930 [Oceanidesulfovibrio indonesiensis]|uniref:Uncharacterized protein n=1 Tax=Oceanidesulfovibrio indonesiensis TaxID=54767 RepID=A0A7M3MEU9_9BACT|nr:hypothetical protein DPQ33_09930 [Oceanidesulfovibrio indonesiensis]